MKVLNIISRYNVGGTAQWLYQLSHGLSENKIENKLLVGNCPKGEMEDERLSTINHIKIAGLGPRAHYLCTLLAFFQIRKEIKKFRPDIVNTHTSKAGVLGRLAAKTVKASPKVIHTYHGHVFYGYFNPIIEFLVKRIEKMLGLFTNQYFVLGEKGVEDLKSLGLINKDNYRQVLPGVADSTRLDKVKTREELGIRGDSFVVGWLGRKVPIKRIDRILNLAEINPDITFLIAGVGTPILESFKDRFLNGNLANVIEKGYATPAQIWSASDVCLITSDNEGIPTSSIEASLYSVPIVSTDAGSIRDVIKDGENGFICSSNIESLSTAIKKLKNDSELLEEMGQNAREKALTKFSPQTFIMSQILGYSRIISKSNLS